MSELDCQTEVWTHGRVGGRMAVLAFWRVVMWISERWGRYVGKRQVDLAECC